MNDNLMQFTKLVPFLGKVMGLSFEVILFDVSKYDLPIVVSENIKDSTAEKARDFVRNVMGVEDIGTRNCWTNHPVVLAPNKISKMSVFFVRNEAKEICAALVLCMRCDEFFKMESFLNSLLQFNNIDIDNGTENIVDEVRNQSEQELSLNKISEYIRDFGIDPDRTNHDEKSEIICDLYDMGIFNLKGAVARTASELGISDKSVYRYLSQIKKARE